ncbi:MAG: hypothetical protein V4489_01945 [Chlamydiota bacterium]
MNLSNLSLNRVCESPGFGPSEEAKRADLEYLKRPLADRVNGLVGRRTRSPLDKDESDLRGCLARSPVSFSAEVVNLEIKREFEVLKNTIASAK